MSEHAEAFDRLVNIVDELREQCPWDKEQTTESLRPLTIEEAYELADAILKNDKVGIKEELGDLMMHLIFYARIAKEQNDFTLAESIHAVCDKLIFRHPHIYGDGEAADADAVKKNWEQIKLKEGKGKGKDKKSVLGGVPDSLPALIKAFRIQDKTSQVGFEWENKDQVWDKVKEEMGEFEEEVRNDDQKNMEAEFGDLIFSLVNYGRFLNIDPETALERTNMKFIQRFKAIEAEATKQNKTLEEMTLEEMEAVWQAAK